MSIPPFDEMYDTRVLQLEAEVARLRDLLAWNGINPDAMIESAKGSDKRAKGGK